MGTSYVAAQATEVDEVEPLGCRQSFVGPPYGVQVLDTAPSLLGFLVESVSWENRRATSSARSSGSRPLSVRPAGEPSDQVGDQAVMLLDCSTGPRRRGRGRGPERPADRAGSRIVAGNGVWGSSAAAARLLPARTSDGERDRSRVRRGQPEANRSCPVNTEEHGVWPPD